MDGSPSRGETIPIRLFLGGFDLTPTFREVNKKYSVRYYLSLVLIDEGESIPIPQQQQSFEANNDFLLNRCPTIFQAVRDCPVPSTTRPSTTTRTRPPWNRWQTACANGTDACLSAARSSLPRADGNDLLSNR